MKPSSSAGSQSSFIRFLASSLVSFSPRFTSSLNSSNSRMVSSEFLSYSFRISTKSWKPPWSLESLQALYMGKTSGLVRNFSPLATPPTDLLDGLQGGVQVAGADEVANVEGVDLAVSLE